MSRQSLYLLRNSDPAVIYVTDPIRVDAWFTNVQKAHTLSITVANLRARVSVEATIKTTPTEADWFPVGLNGQLFIDYPRNGLGNETSTLVFNFSGRFTWMRARVDRSMIIPFDAQPVMIAACGIVDRILLNI
jgi:hypothetical protein